MLTTIRIIIRMIIILSCSINLLQAQDEDSGSFVLAIVETIDFSQKEGADIAETIAWNPNGDNFAVGGRDGLWLFDINYELVAHFDSVGYVHAISWSPDSRHMAMLVEVNRLEFQALILDLNTGYVVPIDDYNNVIATAVTYSPDGEFIAFGRFPREFVVLDSMTFQTVFSYEIAPLSSDNLTPNFPRFLCWMPDNSQLIAVSYWSIYTLDLASMTEVLVDSRVDSGYSGSCLEEDQLIITNGGVLYDLESGDSRWINEDYIDSFAVAWHPSGHYFATNGSQGRVQIWDSESLVVIGGMRGGMGDYEKLLIPYAYSIDWHPGGELLAAVGEDNILRIWRIIEE